MSPMQCTSGNSNSKQTEMLGYPGGRTGRCPLNSKKWKPLTGAACTAEYLGIMRPMSPAEEQAKSPILMVNEAQKCAETHI